MCLSMNSRSLIQYIVYGILVVFVIAAIEVGSVYHKVFTANVQTGGEISCTLFIPTGSDYQDVLDSLYHNDLIRNRTSFEWTAGKKNYMAHIRAGRYILRDGMSNNELINMLRSGSQEAVRVIINQARTVDELAAKVSIQIEPGENELQELLHDDQFIAGYGFDRYSILGLFVPNTYEIWWNTSAEDFIQRMHIEYEKFWNRDRLGKADDIGLTANGVATLASIVISETNKEDEYRRIAGLYVNRLQQGIKLQADPTVIYALGDFTRQRVLTRDTQVDSPYNTYIYYGLPPGPIAIPSIKAIDAVLDHEKNDYIYFCARDDFSGYHVFARTLEQHNRNAQAYRRALNQQNILR